MTTLQALPRHPAHTAAKQPQPRGRLPDLLHFTAEYLLLLPVGALVALAWANLDPDRTVWSRRQAARA